MKNVSPIMRIRFGSLHMIGVVLASAGAASAQPIADSAADFSGVQGLHNWFYGIYNAGHAQQVSPLNFQLLQTHTIGINAGEDYWHGDEGPGGVFTLIRATRVHPNGWITTGDRREEDQWAVRRWVVPATGSIHVTATFSDLNLLCGNGVLAHVYLESTELWTRIVDSPLAQVYEADLAVTAGMTIDFAVDPFDSWDACDNTGSLIAIRGPIVRNPSDMSTCVGGVASFSVVATSACPVSYQWRCNGQAMANTASVSGADGATLILSNLQLSDSNQYDCVVTTCGGSSTSESARLTVCRADYNCDGYVNSQDFFDFTYDFMMGNSRVDYLNNDGYVNSQDFFDFLVAFFAGC